MTYDLVIAGAMGTLLLALLSAPALPGGLGRADAAFKRRARERGRNLDRWPLGGLWASGVAMLALIAGSSTSGPGVLLRVGAAFAIGAVVPPIADVVWHALHERRLADRLPAALRQIASIVGAGGAPDQAVAQVAAVAPEPVRTELTRVLHARWARLGSLSECVLSRASRLDSPVLLDFSAVLAAAARTGAPISGLILDLAEELESRSRFRNAMRSALKGPVSALMFISIAVWVFAWATPYMFAGRLLFSDADVPGQGGALGGALVPLSDAAHVGLLVATILPWLAVAFVARRDGLLE